MSGMTHPPARLAQRLAALPVVFGLLLAPGLSPGALAVEARGIDRVCPPPQAFVVADPALSDRGTTHGDAIDCAAGYGLVGGFGDGTYRPGQPVTRGQTASAVSRWLERATGFELDLPDSPVFSDQGTTHADAIAKLAAAGIVAGFEDGSFGADEPLTRGQFARIIGNAISYADVFHTDGPLPPTRESDEVSFIDIDDSVFAPDIRALAGTRIATGVDVDRFAPGELIKRGQLASFLMRSADYLDRHQRWKPTATVVTLATTMEVIEAPTDDDAAADDGQVLEPDGPAPQAVATVVLHAFNGTVGYLVELSGIQAPLATDARLTLRLGTLAAPGPVVLALAEAESLEAARGGDGIISGVALEADSAVRLADLLVEGTSVLLELEGTTHGTLRGELLAVR